MALVECPAKQEGSEVVPVINKLIDTVPFDVIAYTLDWHPDDHCSFIENVHNRQLSKQSPVIKRSFTLIILTMHTLIINLRLKKT